MFHVELLEYLPLTMVVFTNVLLRGRQIKQRLHVAVYAVSREANTQMWCDRCCRLIAFGIRAANGVHTA